MENHTLLDVLEAISNSKSLEIFRDIAESNKIESEEIKQKEGISKKQYYTRTQKLLNSGIVKR